MTLNEVFLLLDLESESEKEENFILHYAVIKKKRKVCIYEEKAIQVVYRSPRTNF